MYIFQVYTKTFLVVSYCLNPRTSPKDWFAASVLNDSARAFISSGFTAWRGWFGDEKGKLVENRERAKNERH